MAFALVNFYEENLWDVIAVSNILHDGEASIRVGMKTLVHWPAKVKAQSPTKVPAEISTISGLLFTNAFGFC